MSNQLIQTAALIWLLWPIEQAVSRGAAVLLQLWLSALAGQSPISQVYSSPAVGTLELPSLRLCCSSLLHPLKKLENQTAFPIDFALLQTANIVFLWSFSAHVSLLFISSFSAPTCIIIIIITSKSTCTNLQEPQRGDVASLHGG